MAERESLGTIGVDVEPGTKTQLEGLADSLTRLGDRVKSAAGTINSFGDRAASVGGELRAFVGQVVGAADAIAQLTTESVNLERNSARLGLDFNAAADAAGRFTDETDVMAAATRFAAAGVRLSQDELNALTRTAASFSQNTGVPMAVAFQQITDGTLAGTEALRRFGPEMAALQGPAHTVGERLAAVEQHARGLAPATDDAASSMARLRDTFGDAQREMARGFSDQIGQALQLGSVVRELGGDLDDTTTTMRAVGAAAADVVSAVVNTVASVVAMVGIAGTAVNDALHGRGFAGGEDSQQMYRLFLGRTQAVTDAVDRLQNGGGGRSPAAPVAPAGGASMTFSAEEAAAIDANAAARNRRAGGGGGGSRGARSSGPSLDELMGRAFERRTAGALTVPGEAEAIAADAGKSAAQRQMDEMTFALERERSFTAQFEALHQRRVDAAQESAEGITDALGALGSAYGDAIMAFVTGEATIGEALQGMLSKTLSTIGKEASVKAGFQLAEGLAALFLNPAEAGAHFAAAAAYTGVAATAGALGDVTAVEKSKPSTAGGGSRAAAESLGGTRGGSSRDAPAPVVNNYYAPLVGGRESTDAEAGTRLRRYDRAADVRLTRPRAA